MIPEITNQPVTTDMVMMVFAVSSVAVTAVIWVLSRFQTKRGAKEIEMRLDNSLHQLWTEVNSQKETMAVIRGDVSYIRGRLEPK